MDLIEIKGGNKLTGVVEISGAKNSALPIIIASMLTEKMVVLHNIPNLADITNVISLMINHGSDISFSEKSLSIRSKTINSVVAPYNIVSKTRAAFWVIAPLISRCMKAKVSLPGGCKIGARQVDMHISFLESIGVSIVFQDGYVFASVKNKLKGTNFKFPKISVGATITAIMSSVLISEEITIIENCAVEPEIVDLCDFLCKIGANIKGIGTRKIEILGVKELSGTEHTIISDRIEAGTFMMAAAITGGKLKIKNIDYSIISNICEFLTKTGIIFSKISQNSLHVSAPSKIVSIDLETSCHPGFPTDLQAQFMALMSIANGISIITENIFENRFMHIPELLRMNANINVIKKGQKAEVKGVRGLIGAEVKATDLRASASLVLAGLAAQGWTHIHSANEIDRGYEKIEQKLSKCGAIIRRVN
jgi:UDP-N-acetylglucosamine 1-carboxyvinyltransferase